ncbi:hypothetical protein Agabi119p4_11573 [Agaricus bisporus var. burnettii]|uniref:DUF6533 domain-containing protein n=1 Tax=Agaricus bisporus var. burnettii TaxID=192524 RepID=A0A8H7EUS3_AGABI|nr:hypothetical protein Agabi119p4_11573 [Agaricus bisporus var. burnettii]
MIPRKLMKNEGLMALLEWNWNLPYNSLHLNTRYNIFFAGVALHLHHDNDSWGLLPAKTIIDQYERGLIFGRRTFPEIQLPEDGFEYRLIPLGESMNLYPILRQNEHAPPPNGDQFRLHFYPFDTLPPFRSHLHPKFAIFELGRKFNQLTERNPTAADAAFSSYPILNAIQNLYLRWSHPGVNKSLIEEWKKTGRPDGDGDRQSESSSRTGYDSMRSGVKRRRTGNSSEQGSPTPAGKSSDVMQMENPSSETLSHETLIEHERVYGKGGWTQESLSGWAADASNGEAYSSRIQYCNFNPEYRMWVFYYSTGMRDEPGLYPCHIVASTTLMVFDWILTFSSEVEFIWKAKWNIIKVLYLITRYLPLAFIPLDLSYVFTDSFTLLGCAAVYDTIIIMYIISLLTAEFIFTMRTVAVWGKDKHVAYILFATFATMCVVTPTLIGIHLKRTSQQLNGFREVQQGQCTPISDKSYKFLVATFTVTAAYDTTTLTFMVIRALSTSRWRVDSYLFRTVYGDGISFYIYIFGVSLVNIVFIFNMSSFFLLLQASFHSILACRVVLHIRQQLNRQEIPSNGSRRIFNPSVQTNSQS